MVPSLKIRKQIREQSRFSDQQFRPSCPDHRQTLQMPMANRIVLQMDQAASPHQGLLRNFRKCGKDPNLDCRLHLYTCRHHSKTTPSGAESLHNFADPERYPLRKSTAKSASCKL